jgi:hypothetical protein
VRAQPRVHRWAGLLWESPRSGEYGPVVWLPGTSYSVYPDLMTAVEWAEYAGYNGA